MAKKKCEFCDIHANINPYKPGLIGQSKLEGVGGNCRQDFGVECVVMPYKSSVPELLVTMRVTETNNLLEPMIGKDGVATIYIPIKYCPICGRKFEGAKVYDEYRSKRIITFSEDKD